jgi:Holliday junction resolvase RusA-like endonuclease
MKGTHMTTDEIHLVITGTPAPQGSKVAFSRKGSTKVTMLEQTRKTLDPWREAVAEQAQEQYLHPVPLDVPVSVGMTFLIQRPKSVRRPYPSSRYHGDLSKLQRAVEDALTIAGVWTDDSLVVRYHELAKLYASRNETPGVLISIRPLLAVTLPGRVAPRQGRPDPRDLERLRTAVYGADSDVEPFSA